ncbi:MAG TPA: ABC transporter permease [Bryobacteraceae bacterium]|nr:ABC transporter permease [Bryobacteraceae bacterium]
MRSWTKRSGLIWTWPRDRIERGEDPEAAALAARREFGNRTLVTEITREMRGWGSLEQLWQDIRYALRGMRRSPGFTAVAVLSLGLGIGANTAIFSLIAAVMLRALPVEHPEQLVELLHSYPGESRGPMGGSPRTFAHFRDNNHVFSVLTGTLVNYALVSPEGSEPERIIRESVIRNYFQVLGIKPAIGRLIAPDDEPDGTVAVVSWSYWKARYQLDPAIVGKRVVVDRRPLTIIGVAPRGYLGFQVGYRTDIWFPSEAGEGTGVVFGRLKPGLTLQQARAEVAVLHRFAIDEITRTNKDPLIRQMKSDVAPAAAGHSRVRDRYGRPLLLLMSVVAVLLLIACINTASMLLARAAGRQREMAVRVGLGASRGRLVQQAFTESLLLSGAGALLGLVLAHLGAGILVRIIASGREHERFVLPVQLDTQTLAFTAAVALLTGVLFGLAPVLHVFRTAPASALREAGRAGDTAVGASSDAGWLPPTWPRRSCC